MSCLFFTMLAAAPRAHAQAPQPTGLVLPGHIPSLVAVSTLEGPVPDAQPVGLALSLPLRNEKGLEDLIRDLYDQASPSHGQYLTPQQFADQFGPTPANYAALIAWAQSKGLTVTGTTPARTILDVTGTTATVNQAFNLHLQRYLDPTGREFFAPDADPTVDSSLTGVLKGVIGLDNASPPQPAIQNAISHRDSMNYDYDLGMAASPAWKPAALDVLDDPVGLYVAESGAESNATPAPTGSGTYGYLIPSDIQTAYNLSGTNLNGAGQTIALYELDGFYQSDISLYENAFGLPNVPIQTVLVDGFNGQGSQGPGQVEATGDIELATALAPHLSNVMVYETSSNSQDEIDLWCRIAADDIAKQVSSSWYNFESSASNAQVSFRNDNMSMVTAECYVFEQIAAQGQTVYASSGDNGAYADGYNNGLQVIDPSSQPYVCGVGGTQLTTTDVPNGHGGYVSGPWASETIWSGTSAGTSPVSQNDGGSGGGLSSNWQIPWYQDQPGIYSNSTQNVTGAQGASFVRRDVPDVALNASPDEPYATYILQNYYPFAGTSAAAPLWASFTALVNQQRANNGLSTLGFVNPYVYQIGTGSRYTTDFHDIIGGSNGLQGGVVNGQTYPSEPGYSAGTGYDTATGWGSFNGANLIADLSTIAAPAPVMLPLYCVYDSQRNGFDYTTSLLDVRNEFNANYDFLDIDCHVYGDPNDVPNLTPLYHLESPSLNDNYYTIYPNLVSYEQSKGYTNNLGIACYIFPNGNTPGTVPLYCLYIPPTQQHCYTANAAEYNSPPSGWQQEGIQGYVLP